MRNYRRTLCGDCKQPYPRDAIAVSTISSLLVSIVLAFPSYSEEPHTLAPDRARAGWVQLFDGTTLYGWTPTSDANWTVKDRCIVVSSGEPGFLRSNSEFCDFELNLEFQAGSQTNSGVFVRSTADPRDPTTDCYEINIAPADNPFPTGSIVAHFRSEATPALQDGWRSLGITAVGPKITVVLDGKETAALQDPRGCHSGHILLQFNGGEIRFRHILLRPLAMQPIPLDQGLSHWNRYLDLGGEFTVGAEGELKITGGPGQLETKDAYGDFVLQLECRTNAENLNSGVFFRCIPGARLMGYESQIHNGYRDDRANPIDGGTGAIFRRCNARRIVADDGAWFTKTIVANGAHMAVWVNGYPVSDWNDDRPMHENPRKGKRLEPGTIMLQAHDPTTDVNFRNFRIQRR